MEMEYHAPLIGILVGLMERLSRDEVPVVWNTIRRLIEGAPLARGAYEAVHGKIPGMG
jgi:aminopeptidase N